MTLEVTLNHGGDIIISFKILKNAETNSTLYKSPITLDSGIDVAGNKRMAWKFCQKNKHRALKKYLNIAQKVHSLP